MTRTKALPEQESVTLREQFPILHQQVNGKELVYLDNAATTQKPACVISAIQDYYQTTNSNVHRGAHYLSDKATADFEQARQTVADFVKAQREEILWTRGTTESINMVAQCYGGMVLNKGDEVIISHIEHHSNIVPWQIICQQTGAELKVIPVRDDGSLDIASFDRLLSSKTKIVSVVHVSNSLGTVNPVVEIIRKAKSVGATVVLDGAQAIAHFPINVQELGCDFYAFSGHKIFAPTGIGVLYGRRELLEQMPPYQSGGEMIEQVTLEKSTWNQLPYKFEAGTPNIAGAIGLGAALKWLKQQDRSALLSHENDLLAYATEQARQQRDIQLIGTAENKVSVLSFLLKGAHPNDAGMLLDKQGIAVRTGHHCTMPLMDYFQIPGTIRASFSIYNTRKEVDALFMALDKVRTFL